tara:strand:- start:3145 stop:3804 length:660 start_codon:yes stop_codon:yes gene_type:complete
LAGWVGLLVGVLLVAMAWPRFWAGLPLIGHDFTLARVERGYQQDLPVIVKMVEDYKTSLKRRDNPKVASQLARLEYAFAQTRGVPPRLTRALLDDAIAHGNAGLAGQPMQTFNWAELANARAATQGVTESFQKALRLSILAGPHQPALILSRIRLGLQSWPFLTAENKALIKSQVIIAAQLFPARLAEVPRSNLQNRLVIQLLAKEPTLLRSYQAILRS